RNRHGPVDATVLAALHADGRLDPATLVWREGMAQWQPWHAVMAEVVPAPPAPPGLPAGGDAGAQAEPRSPYAPPMAPVGHAAGIHLGGKVVYAGFWKRVA